MQVLEVRHSCYYVFLVKPCKHQLNFIFSSSMHVCCHQWTDSCSVWIPKVLAPLMLFLSSQLYMLQHVRRFPSIVSWSIPRSISAVQLLLMTFVLDHAPSKYNKVRIHLLRFLTCSTPEVTLLCTVFLRGHWRLDTLVIKYSWFYTACYQKPDHRQSAGRDCNTSHMRDSSRLCHRFLSGFSEPTTLSCNTDRSYKLLGSQVCAVLSSAKSRTKL